MSTSAKTVSMASGSASICSKVKYTTGTTSSDCQRYTVFVLSKKLVRFQFINSEGSLTTCDRAPGSGGKLCQYYVTGAAGRIGTVDVTYSAVMMLT
jgi:hypothetical protein